MLRKRWMALLLVVVLICALFAVSAAARRIVFRKHVGDVSLKVYTYYLSDDVTITRVIQSSYGFAIYTQAGRLAKIRVFAPKSLKDIVVENALEALVDLAFDPLSSLREVGTAILELAVDIAEDAIEQPRRLHSYGEIVGIPTHSPGGNRIVFGGETVTRGQGLPTATTTSIPVKYSDTEIVATRVGYGFDSSNRIQGRTMFSNGTDLSRYR